MLQDDETWKHIPHRKVRPCTVHPATSDSDTSAYARSRPRESAADEQVARTAAWPLWHNVGSGSRRTTEAVDAPAECRRADFLPASVWGWSHRGPQTGRPNP